MSPLFLALTGIAALIVGIIIGVVESRHHWREKCHDLTAELAVAKEHARQCMALMLASEEARITNQSKEAKI